LKNNSSVLVAFFKSALKVACYEKIEINLLVVAGFRGTPEERNGADHAHIRATHRQMNGLTHRCMNAVREITDSLPMEVPDVSCKLAAQVLNVQKWSKVSNTILVRAQEDGK